MSMLLVLLISAVHHASAQIAPTVSAQLAGTCDASAWSSSNLGCTLEVLTLSNSDIAPGTMQYVQYSNTGSLPGLTWQGYRYQVKGFPNNGTGAQALMWAFGVANNVAAATACVNSLFNSSQLLVLPTFCSGLSTLYVYGAIPPTRSTATDMNASATALITGVKLYLINPVEMAALPGNAFVAFQASMSTSYVTVNQTWVGVGSSASSLLMSQPWLLACCALMAVWITHKQSM